MDESIIMSSLFEEDYILRSLGSIVSQPDIAITELVANAWDAGANNVSIFIPDKYDEVLYIEDDGTGMTEKEFQSRWMKLRYNRLASQSRKVEFPPTRSGNRTAFGRNGVGRHGLFCFGDQYEVITSKNGIKNRFTVKPNVASNPFAVIDKKSERDGGCGTRLEVKVTKNLPNAERIAEIISARFLLDPSFSISVNGRILGLADLTEEEEAINIDFQDLGVKLKLYFIDTTKPGRKSVFQGVAFWQAGRLVGEPSWNIGSINVLDGRTTLAKRYTVVIVSKDLSKYIKEDWSGFIKSSETERIFYEVEKVINNCFEKVASETARLFRENLPAEVKKTLECLNPLAKKEFEETLNLIIQENPKARQESVDIAAKAILNLERTKSGKELIEKLALLSDEDIEGLNELLAKWSIRDASAVLDEIDRRLSIITAIRKLSGDKSTDELHVLHPLITEARWLFGPEYESSEFIFNRQLGTVTKTLFGTQAKKDTSINYKKRPDLICLPDSTISLTCVEETSMESNLVEIRKILLIELKRGGFKITRDEKNQAGGYIEDILASNAMENCEVTAFVVGDSIETKVSRKNKFGDDQGTLFVTTYAQLIDTAEKRMFTLRQKIANRYDNVPGMELLKDIPLL